MLSPADVAGVGIPPCLRLGEMLITTSKAFYSEAAYCPLKEDAHLSKATGLGGKTLVWGKLLREGFYFGSKMVFCLHITSSEAAKHVRIGMGCISHTLACMGKRGTKRWFCRCRHSLSVPFVTILPSCPHFTNNAKLKEAKQICCLMWTRISNIIGEVFVKSMLNVHPGLSIHQSCRAPLALIPKSSCT